MFDRLVAIAAAAVVLFILGPLIVIIGASFTTTPFVVFPPRGFTLHWYQILLGKADLIRSFVDSVVLGVLTTAGAGLSGIPAAIGLHNAGLRGRAALRAFVMAPLTLPTFVTGVALLQFYYAIHLDAPLTGLLLGHLLITVPFFVRTVGGALVALDPAIHEAAESLGASVWRTHTRVTIPAIAPSIFAAATFVFITSFDQVTISIFLSTPDVMPLPIRIYNYIEFAIDPMVAAVSTVLIVLAFAIVALMQRLLGLDQSFLGGAR
ncbi:MAG: ABC transporter permease [Alphaproteobacteria bacterium]|nr:ABC transporter permease [Alphaproteobacteria bacterium]